MTFNELLDAFNLFASISDAWGNLTAPGALGDKEIGDVFTVMSLSLMVGLLGSAAVGAAIGAVLLAVEQIPERVSAMFSVGTDWAVKAIAWFLIAAGAAGLAAGIVIYFIWDTDPAMVFLPGTMLLIGVLSTRAQGN